MKGSDYMKNYTDYIILYDEIVAQKMSATRKIAICKIIDLNGKGIIYPSTEYLAKFLKMKKQSCLNLLSDLKRRGYISIQKEYVEEQCTELRSIKITEKTLRLIEEQLIQLIEIGEIDERTKTNIYSSI